MCWLGAQPDRTSFSDTPENYALRKQCLVSDFHYQMKV